MLEDAEMQKLIAKYPENFTGETFIVPDPTPEEHTADMALLNELKTLASPLVNWLRTNYGPCANIHISWDRVDVEQHTMGIPFPYSEK